MLLSSFLAVSLLTVALSGCASQCPVEPVTPQPATPLSYQNPAYHKVTPDVALALMELGVPVIDVREPDEYAAGHIKGSVNVPLSTLKPGTVLEAAPDVTKPVLVHCRSGVRAENASKILVESGYRYVFNMYGTQQWPYGFVTEEESSPEPLL